MGLHVVDLVIIGAYLVAVAAIGVWVARQTSSGDDLFLAGRSLGFFAIGLSLFASNISSTTLIGVTGAAYRSGISVAHYELMAAIILIVMAVFTIPVFLRCRLTTIPEYLEQRFGPAVCKYVSALTIFLSVFVDTAGSVYAGVIVVQTFAPSVPFVPACIALAAFAGLYTAAGGLRAVVYTDVLQAIVLLIGAFVISWQVFAQFDFSWSNAISSIDADKLSLVRPLDDPDLPWLGVLVGLPVLGFYYWGTNQYIMQRVLGARSLDDGRWGAVLAAGLKVLPLFLLALPGALAFSLLPPLENSDRVFAAMIREFVPVGLTGLVLAAFVAAIMSTIDSTLNAASSLVVHDFAGARKGDWDRKKTLWYGRVVMAVFVVIAAFWPLVIREFPGLFNYIQQVFSYAVPPVVAVFLLGIFWRGMSEIAALATLVFGHATGAALMAWRAYCAAADVPDGLPHFTIVAGVTAVACAAVGVLVSVIATRPGVEPGSATLWLRGDSATSRTGLLDYRVQGAVVLVAVALCIYLLR